ncbi:hypothetical protein K439DRAFT_1615493 [Ramaria rubella]|nr:hypothetical protein K439DRAFT_1615493 [Ramaria rubella]
MSSSPAEMGILYECAPICYLPCAESDTDLQACRSLISFYLELVGWTLFFYDYVLQTSREVDLIWKQKATWATIMYMVVRYALFLAYTIPIAAGIGLGMTMYEHLFRLKQPDADSLLLPPYIRSPAQDFCVRLAEWLDICGQISIAVILTLRTFAIYERSLWILALVGAFGLMIPVIGFVIDGCSIWICITLAGGSHIEQAYSAISLPVIDVQYILGSIHRPYVVKICATEGGIPIEQTEFISSGIMARLPVLLCYVVCSRIEYLSLLGERQLSGSLAPRGLSGVGVPLSRSISSVLVCRFVLTLRERYYYPQGTSQGRQQQMSPLVIATPSALESGGTQFAQTRFLGLSSFAFEGSFHRSFAFGDGDTVVIPDAL